jgi:peroxiredoxin
LLSTEVPAEQSNRDVAETSKTYLARVVVEGKALPMMLPKSEALAKYRLKKVEDKEIKAEWELTFRSRGDVHEIKKRRKGGADGTWQKFDHDRVDLSPRLGTAEEWVLIADKGSHPFHIHVNPFEVIKKNAKGEVVERVWRDTILVTKKEPITLRMRFERYEGKTVLHCHNLDHEDQGMMMIVDIVGKGKPALQNAGGLPALPAQAPGWELMDRQKGRHRLSDISGRNVVLVFFRGHGCVHCLGQLRALARQHEALQAAKLTVVAVCPDQPEEMERAIQAMPLAKRFPFLVLSDATFGTFRKYGCYDGQLLHGTFLIDAKGQVQWQHVGDEPFMDVEALLNEHKKRSNASQP